MSKKSVFTTITPLPSTISRETAQEALHDHKLMIDLNPLVIERKLVPKAPHFATAEEYNCKWYLITDRISYMPGRMVTGKVDYYACFHDLPDGIQTHVYAPMGLDIRSRWRIAGTLPGEPRETTELGLGIPKDGLYIREDVTMKCNIMLVSFVKKTFKKAHERLVDRLSEKTHVNETEKYNESVRMSARSPYGTTGASTPSTTSYPGSPPMRSASPRFSAQQLHRPETPSSSSYYPSPQLASQLAAQGQLDPNHPYISPLYHQMDPAYRAAIPYEQQSGIVPAPLNPHGHQRAVSTEYLQHPDMKGYYPPPPGVQQHGLHPQAAHGAVEIASSELQHPAVRQDEKRGTYEYGGGQQQHGAPQVPPKVPQAPAEMEG